MLSLSRVTLVAVDGTPDASATAASLLDAAAKVTFARVLLLSPSAPSSQSAFDWIQTPPLTLKEYNQFCLTQLHQFIDTTHALTIQADSGIVNADAWDPRWLEYDYIGAPWPPGHSGTPHRVGNSGFCLRSKRLLAATVPLPNDRIVWRGREKTTCRDDVITCVMFRDQLEAQGLRFAPPDVAARFAFESPTPESPGLADQFGSHQLKQSRRSVRLQADRGSG